MMPMRRLIVAGTAFALLSVALISVGCGATGDTDPTPVKTFKITPAANATQAPGATSEPATVPASGPTSAITTVAGEPLQLIGTNNTFDPEELAAPAGSITIEFDNRDSGIPHNVHVHTGDDSDGDTVGETDLEVGPGTQTLTMDLESGDYFYVCDAHPNTMSGTLTVN